MFDEPREGRQATEIELYSERSGQVSVAKPQPVVRRVRRALLRAAKPSRHQIPVGQFRQRGGMAGRYPRKRVVDESALHWLGHMGLPWPYP
jgi:hypothetical protein